MRPTGRCCEQRSKHFRAGDRLLVGRDIGDLDGFTDQMKLAVISGVALIFLLAAVASILVTRRTVGRIEQINATSRAIMLSGLDKPDPAPRYQ
jgi:hypothetical protein